jgi:hypothetical protein
MRSTAGGGIVIRMSTPAPRRVAEPKLILLALGAAAVMVLCIVALAETGDIWIGVLTVVAIALIGEAIVLDLRRVIGASGDAPAAEPPAPGRVVVVCTAPMTAAQVTDALGEAAGDCRTIMFVAPEGLGHDHDYARALRAECDTVAALRRAGINAAGHVGDRNPAHAIENALALFPASSVVVVARGVEAEIYREHVDVDAIRRRTGVEVRMLEVVGG